MSDPDEDYDIDEEMRHEALVEAAHDAREEERRAKCPDCGQGHEGLDPDTIRNLHAAATNWYSDSNRPGSRVLTNVEHGGIHGEKPDPRWAAAMDHLGKLVKTYFFDKYHEVYLEKYENGAIVYYVPTGWWYYYPKDMMDDAFDFARSRGTHSRALNRIFGD